MTHRIKSAASLLLLAFSANASALDLGGTWKLEKAVDVLNGAKTPPPLKYTTLQFVGNQVGMGQNCFAPLRSAEFNFPSVFRALLDAGQEEKELAAFLKKNFGFNFSASTDYFMLVKPPSCRDKVGSGLVDGEKLVVPYAGQIVYTFTRSKGGVVPANDPRLLGHIQSQLPFNLNNFHDLCAKPWMLKDGKVQDTEKCTPLYKPYVARKSSNDALDKLIGNFDYSKSGAEYTADYAPPFAKDLHPTYLVLPPLKDVLLVRVEDMEPGPNSERDTMGGAYLSIKGGKVVDQLHAGCNIDETHACVSQEGAKLYQLLESGKFKRLSN